MKCKWYDTFENACANGSCPYSRCPTSEHPEVCKYSENTENKYEVSELAKILRCCSNIGYVCEECPANLDGEDCDGRLAKQQAADMLEKLAAEKDAKKPEWIEQQRTAISAIETCRQLKKSLFEKENVTNDELVRMVLQLKSGDTKIEKERKRREER